MDNINTLIVVRGGGDIATGTIHRLVQCKFKVVVLEIEKPSAIRRQVSFAEAIYDGVSQVEGVTCRKVERVDQINRVLLQGEVPILVDGECNCLKAIRPRAVVDAILAKKNMGTTKNMAECTIALGPGFEAGVDVDYVIETMRGHNLGRILTNGFAYPDTKIPGIINGYGKERVIHAASSGRLHAIAKIGDYVKEGQIIANIKTDIQEVPVYASISGILRGVIRDDFKVTKGFKIADIDPRTKESKNCFTISDKARCIAGSVLEALLRWEDDDEASKG